MAQRGAWTPNKVRERIRTSMLVKRLTDHALGKIDMTASQVTAVQILLKKSLPDLSSIEHSGMLNVRSPAELSDAELASIATSGSAGIAESQEGIEELREVH